MSGKSHPCGLEHYKFYRPKDSGRAGFRTLQSAAYVFGDSGEEGPGSGRLWKASRLSPLSEKRSSLTFQA